MDAGGDAMPRVVNARRDPVPAVGFYGRAAAAEGCEQEDGAKREQNISHILISDGAVESSVWIRLREDES